MAPSRLVARLDGFWEIRIVHDCNPAWIPKRLYGFAFASVGIRVHTQVDFLSSQFLPIVEHLITNLFEPSRCP